MAENSKIEWCDHTFNPWSPGCANCYAEARNARFGGGTTSNWGRGKPRRRTSDANWKLPLKWNREAVLRRHQINASGDGVESITPPRPRVFCASLADWLDDEVPAEWQNDLLRLIAETPNLDWLLLTKRPENWEGVIANALLADIDMAHEWVNGRPPANVWIGTTVENQEMADKRIPELLEIPARVRFLSCEPLLGPVDLTSITGILHNKPFNLLKPDGCAMHAPGYCLGYCVWRRSAVHWVICGGESGPKARPMHPDWARRLRDQCAAADVPFLFKQWGEWLPVTPLYDGRDEEAEEGTDPERTEVLHLDGRIWPGVQGQPPLEGSPWIIERTGKKAAGRVLDGVEHNGFPVLTGKETQP